ncbi:Flagellar basal-body rod protein FlgF [Candidatus Trichorickettsia mobilis]|uniref:Flagellar basal-body rod protein FlgF n=1 Tax=Candidatus Trichorickettsia mobilis TaxID=1346319 RepID=A0ABZ0UTS8_9RICK|nr:flagellar hook basal-body protein [Candidatus Trichorickettsia mobilis]WPY00595.1 Flagellar basal-body rod protein FlgF [Candidatus Trichorickettsia mobilis]
MIHSLTLVTPIIVLFRHIIVIIAMLFYCNSAYANNSTYITLSNQIARKTQLAIVANNVANANTTGYEADNVLFKNIDTKQSTKRSNSFVYTEGAYKNGNRGTLQTTNRPMDLAIAGEGYFKILTVQGDRYTLNGGLFINSEYILVNATGLPFASRDGQPILIPVDTQDIRVAADGSIYADEDIIGIIGVFSISDINQLIKEGNNLYSSKVRDVVLDDFTIISGALRSSNVSSTKAMTEMVELQRSLGATNNLMSGIADLERSVITKVAK